LTTRTERRAIIYHWLQRLGIWEHRHKFPAQLSGGQRQRVAIARTLVLQPDLLLMDEPFNSLDALTRERLQDVVIELRAEFKMTTVIVTHAIDEAAVLGSRILVLNNPPHHTPYIIENPDSENPNYRLTEAYLKMRNILREVLGLKGQ
jgi:NitT/TauT family transport system ATP-binding protein